ncbi:MULTISPECIES: sulfurtransferase TusA family protein [Metallosphaera]|nr:MULTISPECIES: sulfurtransferase TusA family protein [Metallosphaera]AKV74508.1 oxidoreductase [Metallosphaera sedula]AKV76747.1 oxidoreductase [Metallosphaera sedula]AKV78998.1 oxidoreductase [Metallosphaera sedula]AKV81243.1 oxidoreductase [Metallosphaera sedula]AKV84341.1 oxidoreductase [Metallosphaera sedula]
MELDLTGLCCAVPQLTLYSALKKLKPGMEIRIITDDKVVLERDIIPLLSTNDMDYSVKQDQDNFVVTAFKRY